MRVSPGCVGKARPQVVVLTDGPRDTRALDELDALVRQLATGPAPDLLLGAGLADEETGRPFQLLRREGAPPAVGSPVGTAGVARVRWTAGQVAVETLAPATTPDPEVEARLQRDRRGLLRGGRPRRGAGRRSGPADPRPVRHLRAGGDATARARGDRAPQPGVRQTRAVPAGGCRDRGRPRARAALRRRRRRRARAGAGRRIADRGGPEQPQAGGRRPDQDRRRPEGERAPAGQGARLPRRHDRVRRRRRRRHLPAARACRSRRCRERPTCGPASPIFCAPRPPHATATRPSARAPTSARRLWTAR